MIKDLIGPLVVSVLGHEAAHLCVSMSRSGPSTQQVFRSEAEGRISDSSLACKRINSPCPHGEQRPAGGYTHSDAVTSAVAG